MKVELVDSMGSDLRIVQAAKVSVGRNRLVQWERGELLSSSPNIYQPVLSKRDHGIVRYMLENHHGTPFEHVLFTFYIQTNIGIMREMQRHRMASFNEISTRYKEMEAEFDLPDVSDMRTQVGRPGHYTFNPISTEASQYLLDQIKQECNLAYTMYRSLITQGLAKEIARGVLPLLLSTEAYMTLNLRSLFNFCSLRMHSTALREIQYIASAMHDQACIVVPETLQLWTTMGQPDDSKFHDCASCDMHLEEVS